MSAPTVPVTIKIADFGGPALPGITVTATMDKVDYTADGVFVGTAPVRGVTDVNGQVVLNLFPNATVANGGVGTVGSVIRVTASPPSSRRIDVQAAIPNVPCSLVDYLVDQEPNGMGASEAAASRAQSARDVSIAQATIATTQAGIATTKAGEAAGSAVAAAASEAAAAINVAAAQFADYVALRAYVGTSKSAYVTGYLVTAAPSGIAGLFTRDDADVTSADNGGTIIVASNGKRWKRVYSGDVHAAWFTGFDALGAADSSSALVAAIAALPTGGGTVQLPRGTPRFNIVITKPVTIRGAGTTKDRSFDANSNYVRPWNDAQPCIQIGNDTAIVAGAGLQDITLYGAGTGTIGLYLAGGAYRNNFRSVSVHDFTQYNIRLLSGTFPVAYNQFVNGHINASVAGSRGLFVGVGAGGSYCEANGVANYGITGPSGTGFGVEVDSSNALFMSNVWIQVNNNCGVKFTKSFAVVPRIRCANVYVDSDDSADALVTGYDTAVVHLGDLMAGLVEVDGKFKQSDGTLVDGVRNYSSWIPYQANLSFPFVYGQLKFLNGVGTAAMDPATYGGTVACSLGNWDFNALLGPLRLMSAQPAGVYLGSSNVFRWQVTDASIRPVVDDTYNVGTASLRPASVFGKVFRPGAGTVSWTSGAGSPEGVATAVVGSLYTRTDGGAGTTLYIKESGVGNVGWIAK
jgi:hypothetical protein